MTEREKRVRERMAYDQANYERRHACSDHGPMNKSAAEVAAVIKRMPHVSTREQGLIALRAYDQITRFIHLDEREWIVRCLRGLSLKEWHNRQNKTERRNQVIAVVKTTRPTFAFLTVTDEAGVKTDAFMHGQDFAGDFSKLNVGSTVEVAGILDTPKGKRVQPGVTALAPETEDAATV